MTCSIGFRAPSRREFLEAFLAEASDAPGGRDPRFTDRGRAPVLSPARIPDDLHETLAGWVRDWRPSATAIDAFVGRFLTEPKSSVWFDADPGLALDDFTRRCRQHGVYLDRRSRMLWRSGLVHVNGESLRPPAQARTRLRRLADQRFLQAHEFRPLPEDDALLPVLHEWAAAGWLHAAPAARAGA